MGVKINARVVKARLLDFGWEQKDLAAAANLTETTVSRLLNGGDFTSRTLGALALALECNPADLIQPAGYAPPLVGAPVAVTRHA